MARCRRLSAVALLLLAGCGFVHDETLVGKYKLVAVDVTEDMTLCWYYRDACVGLVGDGTVFAVGFNDKYIVAAKHPDESKRSVTQYFYIVRDPAHEDRELGPADHDIKGPLDEETYAIEKARLHLPEFTRIFDDLK